MRVGKSAGLCVVDDFPGPQVCTDVASPKTTCRQEKGKDSERTGGSHIVWFSESRPELAPILAGKFVPTTDGSIEEIGAVTVEEGFSFFLFCLLPGSCHKG